VYQALVYLPLDGSYTFEVYGDKGFRLYVNGSLLIDRWSGAGSVSVSTTLSAGWYNITVKYWQSSGSLRLILGVVLPDGTAVRPLRPIHGVQVKPVNTSCVAPPVPSGLSLVPFSPPLTSASGELRLALGGVGLVNTTLFVRDYATGLVATVSDTRVWDAVYFAEIRTAHPRYTVGDTAVLNVTAYYAYDGQPFQGSFTLNDTLTKTAVGLYWYRVTGISDTLYGLTKFAGSTSFTVIFDKLVIDQYWAEALGRVLSNNSRVDYT
jgi:PA14 domain.